MQMTLPWVTMVLLAAQASGDSRPTPGEVKLPRSLVSLINHVQLPARQAGVLQSLSLPDGTIVQEGVSVKRGDILGKLDDSDARARLRAAETEQKVAIAEQAKAEAGIMAADATIEVAKAEVEESRTINKGASGSIPQTQVRRQELTVVRATSEAEVAKRELETATLTIDAKQAQLDVATITRDHHQIESPLDGVIVQMYRRVGEWVSPGDAIMKIVYMDKVRVEGFVNADAHLPDEIAGCEVELSVSLPHGRVEKFQSTISYVSPLVEASGEYRVWCDVQNRQLNGYWILRPGGYAEMSIKLGTAPAGQVAVRP